MSKNIKLNVNYSNLKTQHHPIMTYSDKNVISFFNKNNETVLKIDNDNKIYYLKNNELKEVVADNDLIEAFTLTVHSLTGMNYTNYIIDYHKKIIKRFLNNLSIKNRRFLKINEILS